MRIAGFVHEEEAIDVQFVKNVAELGQWVRVLTAAHALDAAPGLAE